VLVEREASGAYLVACHGSLNRHVAVELWVFGVRRPAGRHELREHGERVVREDCVEGSLHELRSLLDVLGPVLVEVGLDVDDDVDAQTVGDGRRDVLDAAGGQRSHLAIEAGGDDLLAGVLQQLDGGCVRQTGRHLVEGRYDEGANHGHGSSSFLVVNRYSRVSACRSNLRTRYIIA